MTITKVAPIVISIYNNASNPNVTFSITVDGKTISETKYIGDKYNSFSVMHNGSTLKLMLTNIASKMSIDFDYAPYLLADDIEVIEYISPITISNYRSLSIAVNGFVIGYGESIKVATYNNSILPTFKSNLYDNQILDLNVTVRVRANKDTISIFKIVNKLSKEKVIKRIENMAYSLTVNDKTKSIVFSDTEKTLFETDYHTSANKFEQINFNFKIEATNDSDKEFMINSSSIKRNGVLVIDNFVKKVYPFEVILFFNGLTLLKDGTYDARITIEYNLSRIDYKVNIPSNNIQEHILITESDEFIRLSIATIEGMYVYVDLDKNSFEATEYKIINIWNKPMDILFDTNIYSLQDINQSASLNYKKCNKKIPSLHETIYKKQNGTFSVPKVYVIACVYGDTQVHVPGGFVEISKLLPNTVVIDSNYKEVNTLYTIKFCPTNSYIKISKDALAPNSPSKDLFIKNGHPILLNGKEVHPETLINGTTIVKAEMETTPCYSLCTKDRIYVYMNNVAVCTWSEVDFKEFVEKHKCVWTKVC